MALPIAAAGLVASGLGGIFKMIKGAKQNKLADKVVIPDVNYSVSPFAQRQLAEAERLKNAQMPGMQQAQQGILGSQANVLGGASRNASSGAQLLSMLAASQGQADNATNQLAGQQGQFSMNMLNNYNQGLQGMTQEQDKLYQDEVRKQMLKIQEKNALRNAGTQNMGGGMNDITNGLMAFGTIQAGQKK